MIYIVPVLKITVEIRGRGPLNRVVCRQVDNLGLFIRFCGESGEPSDDLVRSFMNSRVSSVVFVQADSPQQVLEKFFSHHVLSGAALIGGPEQEQKALQPDWSTKRILGLPHCPRLVSWGPTGGFRCDIEGASGCGIDDGHPAEDCPGLAEFFDKVASLPRFDPNGPLTQKNIGDLPQRIAWCQGKPVFFVVAADLGIPRVWP